MVGGRKAAGKAAIQTYDTKFTVEPDNCCHVRFTVPALGLLLWVSSEALAASEVIWKKL